MLKNAALIMISAIPKKEYYAKTNELINKKAHAIFNSGMTPIVCKGRNPDTVWNRLQE